MGARQFPSLEEELPIKASRQPAVPRFMSDMQFERVVTQSARLSLLLLGALALIIALALGKVILAPITLAIVVGLMFGPVADGLERRGVPAALSAGVVVVGFLGLLTIAAMMFAQPLSYWIARGPVMWEKLQAQLANFKAPLESLGAIQDQLRGILGSDAALTVKVQDGGPALDVALMAPSILADVLLFLAGLYFFLATRHHIRISVLSLCFSRRMRWRAAHIFRDVEAKVSRFLISAALINLGVGVATAIATYALGLPSPLLWGALAMVLNFIPYVGQAVMFVVLFAVGLGTQSDLIRIILPVIAYGAINLTADQIVFPHLVGRALTLNPFIIFVSIAFWLWVWGPMGGFIAVPTLLVLQSIVTHIFPTTQNLPRIVARKLEQRAEAGEVSAAPSEAPVSKRPATSAARAPAPKTKRAPRKTATLPTP
jgi:predicted PurR-regulated permease PerM